MKAWQCNDARPMPGLVRSDIPAPRPAPGELLIRVHAAGVTTAELQWYPTTHTQAGSNRRHAVPGHEFSGVVVSADEGLGGGEVFGMNDWFTDGAVAEYCCAPPTTVLAKPTRLTHIEAASVPISALTAWQAFERTGLQPGERVLIHGAAGAVGIFGVQLARQRGGRVIATASARDREFLLGLGVQQAIDYRTERFEQLVAGIDVVFDTVGGETLQRSWQILAPGGRLATVAASGESVQDERTRRAFFIVEPKQDPLREIARMFDAGQLQAMVKSVVPFEDASRAFERQTGDGHGKVVIAVL